jgi:hypothetical protein
MEGLDQLKNAVTSSEIEPATFRLEAYATGLEKLWRDAVMV